MIMDYESRIQHKVMLPPRNPKEWDQPTFVNHKQANRIIIMRQKKTEKMLLEKR